MKLKGIITIVRIPFLILSLILGALGAAVAWYEMRLFGSMFNMNYALLATFGLLIAHSAVNIFNDYFDAKSGLDFRITRTPFSGGSGATPDGLLTIKQDLHLGIICIVLLIPIGLFFIWKTGWMLLPLLILAVLLIIFYTPFILKMGYPEWSAGLGLGTLPVLGAYFVQTGQYSLTAFIASMPSFFLVHNLLLLNEFPDAEADITVKRRTLPIFIGKKGAAYIFSAVTALVYLWIILAVVFHYMPATTLISLFTLPLAYLVIKGSFFYDNREKFLPVMAKNVQLVLLTQALLAVGYILGGIIVF